MHSTNSQPKKGRLHLPGLVGSLQPSTPLTDLDRRAEVITPRLVLLSCVHMHAHAGQSDTGAPSTDAEHIETTDVPTASVTICKACANPMGKRMHTCSKKRDRTASSTTERLSRASRARSDASKAPSSLVASGAAAVPVQACTSPWLCRFTRRAPFRSFRSSQLESEPWLSIRIWCTGFSSTFHVRCADFGSTGAVLDVAVCSQVSVVRHMSLHEESSVPCLSLVTVGK